MTKNSETIPEEAQNLIELIHGDGKEHPYESGKLAALMGRTINSNPWINGCGPHEAFRAGWKSASPMVPIL
jgi:hypothetical protein